MGVEREQRWEVQWHPASGRAVYRIVLSRRRIRWILVAGAFLGAIILVLLAMLPLGLRAVVTRLSADASRRENTALYDRHEVLLERGRTDALRVSTQVQRARRLSWALRLPPSVWGVSLADDLPDGTDLDGLIAYLRQGCGLIVSLGDALAQVPSSSDCGPMALPTASPLEPGRSVPIAHFGWRRSPFTDKEEAHHGLTLAAPVGEAVMAPGAGRVAYAAQPVERRANEWTRFGKIVVLDHGCGVYTVFAHLGEIDVRRGVHVMRGERLGSVGRSGWTSVPALYYEIRWPRDGVSVPVDPALINLALRPAEIDQRLVNPGADLPDDYPALNHLRGIF